CATSLTLRRHGCSRSRLPCLLFLVPSPPMSHSSTAPLFGSSAPCFSHWRWESINSDVALRPRKPQSRPRVKQSYWARNQRSLGSAIAFFKQTFPVSDQLAQTNRIV